MKLIGSCQNNLAYCQCVYIQGAHTKYVCNFPKLAVLYTVIKNTDNM